MIDDPPPLSNWDNASQPRGLDLETRRLIVLLVREHYEQSGQWPTPTELRAALRRPGR